jgi:histidine decarboxylase
VARVSKSNGSIPTLAEVVDGAVGHFDKYCMGYMNPLASGYGYISTLKLSTGIVSVAGLDPGTEGIVSYDRCEKNDAYIGQINMLTASSFCGVNGAVWGYHLAVADEIASGSMQPMYYQDEPKSGKKIPVYHVGPLLNCAIKLFGTEKQRRFQPMPGAHVICANKSATYRGPTWVWAAIALAIAEDRESQANLFIEDCDKYGNANTTKQEVIDHLNKTERNVTKSMIMCGVDQGVTYSKIFCGYKYVFAPADYVGCALTCAPYVQLAKKAIPPNKKASAIINMTITQWENALKLSRIAIGKDDGHLEHRAAS